LWCALFFKEPWLASSRRSSSQGSKSAEYFFERSGAVERSLRKSVERSGAVEREFTEILIFLKFFIFISRKFEEFEEMLCFIFEKKIVNMLFLR